MNVIVAVDQNWAIGYNNKLLTHIPSDLKYFRNKTLGKVIVMGRKTLESFPQGKALDQRTNIVLTKDKNYKAKDCILVHSKNELDDVLAQYNSDDVFIIGGGSVYEMMLDECDVAYVTKIEHEFQADTYFPKLDENPNWELIETSEEQTCFNLEYFFTKYVRT